jgi:uncharacterized protein (TIGR00251 family)
LASLEGRRNREPADSRTLVDGNAHAWARQDGGDALLNLHVVPGAKVTAIRGLHGDRLKIAIAAPPAGGKANEALLDFFAACLSTSRRFIHLHKGATSRDKTVRIERGEAASIARQLLAWSRGPKRK